MDAAPSRTDASRDRATRGPSWLMMNAGTVLFLCVFLPALETCGDPIYPIEFIQHPFSWPLLLPYLLGLVAAVVAMKQLFFPTAVAHRWQSVTIVVGLLCYVAATLVYAVQVVYDPVNGTIPMLLCLVLVVPAVRVLSRRAELAWRCARAVGVGAAACVVYFGTFVGLFLIHEGDTDGDALRVGMWFSLGSALTLAMAARQWELQLDPPPPPVPPPLPPARARKRSKP